MENGMQKNEIGGNQNKLHDTPIIINKENLVLTINNFVFYNFFTITSDN
jgi:hypothetical protein